MTLVSEAKIRASTTQKTPTMIAATPYVVNAPRVPTAMPGNA